MMYQIKLFARYAAMLRRFLREPLRPDQCRALIKASLANRQASFLHVVEHGIFGQAQSPYRTLMEWAGLEFGDVARLVEQDGIEGTLARLYDAGVYVTIAESKGRQPLQRGSQQRTVRHEDFDNPLSGKHIEGRSGGSGGSKRRIMMDLDMVAHLTAINVLYYETFGLTDRPLAVWRLSPPAFSGLNKFLMHAKLGWPAARWFTQNDPSFKAGSFQYAAFTHFTRLACGYYGAPQPAPEYTPVGQEPKIARWLAAQKKAGTPAHLDTLASGAVRVCLAAQEHGLDIAGTFFRVGGEPFTVAKARTIEAAGCKAVCHYAMTETGRVGNACGDPWALDDVHLLSTKIAAHQRPLPWDQTDPNIQALYLTTLLPSSPKLLLNAESGDCGLLTERTCTCPLGEVGLTHHFHQIRSYEKLTGEGMAFLGSDLIVLLEEVLPRMYGGTPMDYQFLEEQNGALSKLSLLVSPELGPLNADHVVQTILSYLSGRDAGHQMMSDVWRDSQTLQVIRRTPYQTGAAKMLHLHVHRRS